MPQKNFSSATSATLHCLYHFLNCLKIYIIISSQWETFVNRELDVKHSVTIAVEVSQAQFFTVDNEQMQAVSLRTLAQNVFTAVIDNVSEFCHNLPVQNELVREISKNVLLCDASPLPYLETKLSYSMQGLQTMLMFDILLLTDSYLKFEDIKILCLSQSKCFAIRITIKNFKGQHDPLYEDHERILLITKHGKVFATAWSSSFSLSWRDLKICFFKLISLEAESSILVMLWKQISFVICYATYVLLFDLVLNKTLTESAPLDDLDAPALFRVETSISTHSWITITWAKELSMTLHELDVLQKCIKEALSSEEEDVCTQLRLLLIYVRQSLEIFILHNPRSSSKLDDIDKDTLKQDSLKKHGEVLKTQDLFTAKCLKFISYALTAKMTPALINLYATGYTNVFQS
ncbi:hypothetical protein BDY19DRAFT_906542 [Irpex rosettiformis]|uniref:Uncharacterized protein n=1 Tax=Irpex rosettiformis TaxID=378272 RepID=A0ACB8U2J6_9APHY|nr:hypothetical protein BDY19DRAFT_906542 [Irpex rosettiformis]